MQGDYIIFDKLKSFRVNDVSIADLQSSHSRHPIFSLAESSNRPVAYTMPRESDPFFPAIGAAAEQVDRLPDTDAIPKESAEAAASKPGEEGSAGVEEDEEERPMHEVSSLCMVCGEQVRMDILLPECSCSS